MVPTNDGDDRIDRRKFLAGFSGLVAAAAYSRHVPESVAAQVTSGDDSDLQSVTSPDGSIEVAVDVTSGVPHYSVEYDGTTYVNPSPLGFNFEDQEIFGTGVFGSGPDITVTGSENGTETEVWDPVWGDFDTVSEGYNFLTLGLEETGSPGRSANLQIRVFDDGLGFRVVFDENFGDFVITSENTEYNFADDYTSWWIENELVNPRFEQEYEKSPLSGIPAGDSSSDPNDVYRRLGAHTPLTMRADDGTYLSVHESDLDDYASMTLTAKEDDGGHEMATFLTPEPDGTKVTASAPHVTPWRTIQIADSPSDLIESQLIPLLASPLDDDVFPDGTDWIDDGRKYVGIWWTMIAGSAHWEYRSDGEIIDDGGNPASYIHGARTERMKRYMTFASENGIDSVLVEGWNEGWDTYPGDGSGLEFGVDQSYPDFDVQEVTSYGSSLDPSVEMTMHNETAGNIVNYEDGIENEDIFAQYEAEGIRSIKNGYVSDPGLGFEGDGANATHTQHCQSAVNHHRMVIKEAAKHRQLLEIHEGIKPTGEIRTYPNVANREVVTAQEFDGFDALISNVGREHHVTIPFTRMLAGPTSYQPGIFDITFNDDVGDQVQTTRAKQLAMYPNYLSGLQMAADRMEAYVSEEFEVGEFVQAQSGAIDGMITEDTWRNSFGANYVAVDPSRASDGATVSFTVKDVPSAGTYDLHLRYAADSEENRQDVIDNGGPEATLVVNGNAQKITPDWTDYWDVWEIHTVPVSLQEGDNTIEITLEFGDVGGFNLNTVGVTDQGVDAPFPARYTDYGDWHVDSENFETKPEFKFIEDVPVSWDETVAVDGEIGEYIVTAKRSGDEWYLGAMTNEDSRTLTVDLDFLDSRSGGWFVEEYADADDADVDANPTAVEISEYTVAAGDTISLSLATSGGAALRIVPDE